MKRITRYVIYSIIFLIAVQILFRIPAPLKIFDAVWKPGDLITFVGTISLGLLVYSQNEKLNIAKYTVNFIQSEYADFSYINNKSIKNSDEKSKIEASFIWFRKNTKLIRIQIVLRFKIISNIIPTGILINNIGIYDQTESRKIVSSEEWESYNTDPVKPVNDSEQQDFKKIWLYFYDEKLEEILSLDAPHNFILSYDLYFYIKIGKNEYRTKYFVSQVYCLKELQNITKINSERFGRVNVKNQILQYQETILM